MFFADLSKLFLIAFILYPADCIRYLYVIGVKALVSGQPLILKSNCGLKSIDNGKVSKSFCTPPLLLRTSDT